MIGLSLLATAGFSVASGTISEVSVQKVGPGVQVKIVGEGLSKPKETRTTGGTVLIYSFDATLKAQGKRQVTNYGGVSTIQWTQFSRKPLVSRVVFKLRPTDNGTVTPTEDGWLISINVPVAEKTEPTSKSLVLVDPPKPTTVTEVVPITDPLTEVISNSVLPKVTNEQPKVVASGVVDRTATTAVVGQGKRISLDFSDTDVVMVLKALASQADVNIVTSPDVKGQISISLKNVSVDEALTVVTAIAGLRYQKLDRTIIVAPPDKLTSIIQNASAGTPSITAETEIRIVPIYSKQGRQVKSALYRVLPQDTRGGRYEVVLPSEQVTTEFAPATTQGGNGAAAAAAQEPTAKSDDYVMVVGSRTRLADAERMVRELDRQICDAIGIETPTSSAMVTQTYLVMGAPASELMKALGATAGKIGDVQVSATPDASSSRQTIVLTGRENEVNRLMSTLKELDGTVRAEDEITVYEVRFSDPRGLRDELMMQIPGLRATIPPAGVGNVRVYVPNSGRIVDPKNANGADSSTQGSATTNSAQAAIEKSEGLKSGINLPFAALEPLSVPMRLILRGDKDQIARAMKLMEQLDKEPRQLAIEVRVMELRKDEAINAGLDWNLFTGGAVKFIRLNNTVTDPKNSMGVGINDKNLSGDVVGTLDKIANKNNLIARPNLIAYDGRQSELFIGDVIRYVESITSSQNGPSVQIGEVRVGVNLSVLPRLSDDGTATMDVRPTVSFLREFKQYQISGFTAELPQTSERQTQQTLAVRSGETIAIGGLITEEMVSNVSGVPILMDLPILGNFFRSTRTQKNRRELVVFITTNIVNTPLGAGDRLPMTKVEPTPEGDKKP